MYDAWRVVKFVRTDERNRDIALRLDVRGGRKLVAPGVE
jgi:hypothetical protein